MTRFRSKGDLGIGAGPEWAVEVKMARAYGDTSPLMHQIELAVPPSTPAAYRKAVRLVTQSLWQVSGQVARGA